MKIEKAVNMLQSDIKEKKGTKEVAAYLYFKDKILLRGLLGFLSVGLVSGVDCLYRKKMKEIKKKNSKL